MRIRPTARVLVIDEQQRLLLFHIHDSRPLHLEFPEMDVYWVTPGGGIEADESPEQAARRELYEEAGIQIDNVGPCVWVYERLLNGIHGLVKLQERFFLVRVSNAVVSLTNMLPYEQESHRAYRWWSCSELLEAQDAFLPPMLPTAMQQIFEGQLAAEPIRLCT